MGNTEKSSRPSGARTHDQRIKRPSTDHIEVVETVTESVVGTEPLGTQAGQPIRSLGNKRSPERWAAREQRTRAHVYAIGGAGLVKVGRAADPAKRLADMQVGSPVVLELLGLIELSDTEKSKWAELVLHRELVSHRSHGEWYAAEPALSAMRKFVVAHRLRFVERDRCPALKLKPLRKNASLAEAVAHMAARAGA